MSSFLKSVLQKSKKPEAYPTLAETTLRKGAAILAEILAPHGFKFGVVKIGPSSGGYFATGRFTRKNRALEFHFRNTLGIVSYHLGDLSMFHWNYMACVLGKENASHYPTFSDDPLDGFRHLRDDLRDYGYEFLSESDEQLRQRIAAAAKLKPKGGLPR